MKQFLLKFGALTMAFMVLFSSTSFTISKHFCKGELASVSYFVSADGCGLEASLMQGICDSSGLSAKITKKSCCDTKTEFIDGSYFSNEIIKTISLEKEGVYLCFLNNEINLSSSLVSKKELFYNTYHPPSFSKNFTILYETYLI